MNNVHVTQHAADRAVQHFRVPKLTADEWVRTNVRKATFIANITNDDGKPCRLFAFQRAAFVLAADVDTVITIYPQNYAVTEIQRKVAAIIKRELAAAERKERATEREIRVEKAKLGVEAANCRLRMEVTPSKAVIRTNTARLTKIDEKMAELDSKLFAAKREKTSIAKSIVAYV